ncbi:MAG: ATP synthase subunit I [Burkholderiales bacterium]|nr:ATP synthase subunit I [Burkholderiales bacterium]
MSQRPTTSAGQPGKSAGPSQREGWHDEEDEAANGSFKRLSREEAAALRAKEPPVSPWRVVVAQVAVGVVAALLGWLLTGRNEVAWSLLYGAATVVVPGALMARGMTSRLSSMAPGTSAVSFMLWEFLKIGVSVVMLVVANRIVQPLVWPALLVGLVVCIKVYWVALLWRRAK